MTTYLTRLSSFLLLLLLWVLAARFSGNGILPGPGEVLPTLWELISSGEVVEPLRITLGRTFLGFLLGFVLGLIYGVGSSRSYTFAAVADTPLTMALFAPTLVVVFLGLTTVGINSLTVVLVAGFISAPKTGVYVKDALRGLDPSVLAMADSFKVGRWSRLTRIYLPYLAPVMLSVARVGFSHAWKIVLLAEVLGFSSGIGYRIELNYSQYNLPELLAWLSLFILVLLVYEQIVRLMERIFIRWR